MTRLTVGFEGSDIAYAAALASHLMANGIRAEGQEGAVVVDASSFADCDRLGRVIADFVRAQPNGLPFCADGPGGDSVLYQYGNADDAAVISGLLASCAFLQ